MRGRSRYTVWALRGGSVVLLLGAWVFATGPGDVAPLLLPDIGTVVEGFLALITSAEVVSALATTFLEIAVALLMAIAAGLIIGFWGARSELRSRTLETLFAWAYLVPHILFYPLFMLWFGIGIWSKIAFAAAAAFLPIVFNAIRAFRDTDPRFLKVARAFGATQAQTDWLIKFRAALPMVAAGVRVGAATCMILVVLTEMLASREGLGNLLARFSQTFAVADSYATILLIVIVAGVFQSVLTRALTTRHS